MEKLWFFLVSKEGSMTFWVIDPRAIRSIIDLLWMSWKSHQEKAFYPVIALTRFSASSDPLSPMASAHLILGDVNPFNFMVFFDVIFKH